MKKSLLEFYALAICFFAVGCFVVTTGIALYDVVQIVVPEFTLHRTQYERLDSNETFRVAPVNPSGGSEADRRTLDEARLTTRRQAALAQALRIERRDGQQSLLRMAIIAFVDAVAFLIHWRIARRARLDT